MKGLPADAGAVLFVAHPGHEVLLYGWLEFAQPHIFVLTDGSGRSGESNIDSTKKLAERLGVRLGSFVGRYTDRQIYQSLIDQDHQLFVSLVDELVEHLCNNEIRYVVTDAAEGYCTTHDLCHFISTFAVKIANKTSTQKIEIYDYAVVGKPGAISEQKVSSVISQELNEQRFQRKLRAARTYYPDLSNQVEAALVNPAGRSAKKSGLTPMASSLTRGLEDLRIECLRSIDVDASGVVPFARKPYYETRGEENVEAGYYEQVIRLRRHILPVIDALQEHAARSLYARASYSHH